MKNLQSVMEKMKSNLVENYEAEQRNEILKKQVSENAKTVIDDLFIELKSCYPAWKQAFNTKESWSSAKKTWTKAFIENDIYKQEQITLGLAAARKGDNPFWPSVGQFIMWCQGPQIDTDDAFNRMINKEPCNGVAEWQTRQECGYRCKQQLPEDKARRLFGEVLTKNIGKVRTGELQEREINPVQISSPEVIRKTETPDQRNIRLDQEIEQMLADKKPLLGPHKNRYKANQEKCK